MDTLILEGKSADHNKTMKMSNYSNLVCSTLKGSLTLVTTAKNAQRKKNMKKSAPPPKSPNFE